MDGIESILNRMKMSKEECEKRSEQHRKDFNYIEKNIDVLRRNFPNNWVASYNEGIVAHHKDYGTLCKQLEKMGIDYYDAVKMYIGIEPIQWILSRIPSLSPV